MMKKVVWQVVVLSLSLGVFCNAETLRVSPRGQVGLQETVDFAQPGDTIILEEGIYELDSALTITDTEGIVLQGEGEVWLLCTDVYENVITVEFSHDIHIYGLKARHKEWVPEYTCNGSVLYVANSRSVEVLDCEFNGCGAIGIYLENVKGATISYCYLHHNSLSALYLNKSSNVVLTFNRIMDNASFLSAHDTGYIEMFGNVIVNNE